VFRTFRNCVTAVKAYLDYAEFSRHYVSPWADGEPAPSEHADSARSLLPMEPATMSEPAAKRLLAEYGIASSRDILCRTADEARAAAAELTYPVVLKLSSPAIAHKSEHGLVRVGVGSPAECDEVFADLMQRGGQLVTADEIEGVLVCEQVSGGVEMVVGIFADELFGPTVMVGIGGVAVEVYRDVSFRVPPFDRAEASRMLYELKGSSLLLGHRGQPAVDIEGLLDVIMSVQQLAIDRPELAELDINPLVALPGRVVALDALAVTRSV